jgi:NAD(P)-dependent dehydrogenase (short-subunit alcohol dehydrogenase family)
MPEVDIGAAGVTVVTGSSGLIGSAIMNRLARLGLAGVGIDLRASATSNRTHTTLICDLTDRASLARVFDQVDSSGAMDKIIHCAALNDAVEHWHAAGAAADSALDVLRANIVGTANVIDAAAAHMIANGTQGSILVLASMYAHVAPDPDVYRVAADGPFRDKSWAYVASKGACVAMIRHYAVRLAPAGIRLNGLSPGGVANGQADTFVERYARRTPLGRMATADEIARTAIALVGDDASYLAGEVVLADGGYTAW